MKIKKKNVAYVATNEITTLLCAYGVSPGKALREIGKLIDKAIDIDEFVMVTGMNVSYDEDGIFCANATISTVGL